jgi:hypothetical protein
VIVPGLFVHLPAAQDVSPGMGGPLSASGIAAAVEETVGLMVGQKVDDSLFLVVQSRIRDILEHQSAIRCLPGPPRDLYSVPMSVDYTNTFVIAYGPDWAPAVDRHLWNRECRRCGSLVTAAFEHTRDECDLALARDVIDS